MSVFLKHIDVSQRRWRGSAAAKGYAATPTHTVTFLPNCQLV